MKHVILILAANPRDIGRLAFDREARSVHVELKRSGYRDRFEFVTRWAAESLDLLRELRELRPTIVHFSGHGAHSAGPTVPTPSRDITSTAASSAGVSDGLVFGNGNGSGCQAVTPDALASALGAASSPVRLVVLNACYTASVAKALLAHVDCVVGMSGAVHDDAARSFAIGFYSGLGEHGSVAAAFKQGAASIHLDGLPNADRPQLQVRDGFNATELILAAPSPSGLLDVPCPYPWMRPHMADEAERFHGRDTEIAHLATRRTSILFLTADPSDASRLRLGQELRDIQSRLRMANVGDAFELHHRASVRPGDLTQAIFDTRPALVHFSGHGSQAGELLLENDAGQVHPVTAAALEALFALCKDEIRCVILNACYSRHQALAISRHIDYVVGMRQDIGDVAAIAFSVGFYKALGAGRAIPDCFEFGRTELQLLNIPGYQIPCLLHWPKHKHRFLEEAEYCKREVIDDVVVTHYIEFPPEYDLYAKFQIYGCSKRGCILIDPEAYECVGHLLDDIYVNYLHDQVPMFSYGTAWLITLSGLLGSPLAPWQWVTSNEPQRALSSWMRETSPAAAALERGRSGNLVVSRRDLSEDYLIVASDDDLVLDVLRAGIKAVAHLVEHLAEVPAATFDGSRYRHTIAIECWFGLTHGVFVDHGLSASARAVLAHWLRKA